MADNYLWHYQELIKLTLCFLPATVSSFVVLYHNNTYMRKYDFVIKKGKRNRVHFLLNLLYIKQK